MTGRGKRCHQMRILIAPDKFKGSLGAREVAQNIAAGLREVLPEAVIEIVPMADGGEGTASVICQARVGEWIACQAHDAIGRALEAHYLWLPQSQTAVLEMSEAAGLWRLAPAERDPLRASTFGVGEIVRDAISRGATEIMVGLGGSATNDAGLGMARALGFRFLAKRDQHDYELGDELPELRKLKRIVGPGAFRFPRIIAAADVRNPLLGERGATRMFGPQKGATLEQVELLECTLAKLADTVSRDLRCDFRNEPGAGAAGGLGFALMSFCGAKLRSGFDVVADAIGLEEKIKRADIVITGEGKLDAQTMEGKAPAGVANLARKHGRRVYAIVGQVDAESNYSELFDGIYELVSPAITGTEAMKLAAELLREAGRKVADQISSVQR